MYGDVVDVFLVGSDPIVSIIGSIIYVYKEYFIQNG